jgi:hypothetical protein
MTVRALLLVGSLMIAVPAIAQGPALPQSAPPAPLPEDLDPHENLVTFDPGAAQVLWRDHHWLVVIGEKVLKDFGRHEAEARQALRLIQELHLSQRGTVGSPSPVMEYWLAEGQGPVGLVTGARLVPVDPDALRVERIQTTWCLRDDQRVLFHFGLRQDEAQTALAIIRKYHFTQLAILGQMAPSMFLFLSKGRELALSAHPRTSVPTQPTSPKTHPAANQADAAPGTTLPSLPALQQAEAGLHAARGSARQRLQPTLPGWDAQGEWVPLDAGSVQLRQENGVWSLRAGAYTIAAFGSEEAAARQALAVVRHYHFTEHCRVGRPVPVFSYFLVNGLAPRGLMFGLRAQAFQPDRLTVQALGKQWALCEGQQVMVVLGESAADADQLLEAIRRNKFDRICHVGPDGQGLTFLVRVH